MANLHTLNSEQTEAKLFNFYTNQEEVFKLKKGQTPQKQAEQLYRKAKNRKQELDNLFINLEVRQQDLARYQQHLVAIEPMTLVHELRDYSKLHGLAKLEQLSEDPQPWISYQHLGFEIRVGRNAVGNDFLTFKGSYKEDMWLHARDTPGSHVLIKAKAGVKIPNPVLELAGSLAAWHSKRKHEGLCPVIYTEKRFVRKLKGGDPGMVVIDKENVMMVPPISPQQAFS